MRITCIYKEITASAEYTSTTETRHRKGNTGESALSTKKYLTFSQKCAIIITLKR